MFNNLRSDWRTHNYDWSRHGFWALVVYRFGNWRYTIGNRALRMPCSFLYRLLKFVADGFCGIELPCEVKLGQRFTIEHVGGIVVSGDAVFGDDCIIRNGVTVGLRYRQQRGSPIIGNRVDIGAGAKLLGPIRIGNDVTIGANAVVLCDVPDGCVAVGIPARILPRKTSAPHPDELDALHHLTQSDDAAEELAQSVGDGFTRRIQPAESIGPSGPAVDDAEETTPSTTSGDLVLRP